MRNTCLPAVYSRDWGNSVVQRLAEKYGRATEISMELLCMTTDNLVTYLITKDPLFPKLRDFIKKVDKIVVYARPPASMSYIYYTMSKISPLYSDKRIQDRLTQSPYRLIIEEQVNRMGPKDLMVDRSLSTCTTPQEDIDYEDGTQLQLGFI